MIKQKHKVFDHIAAFRTGTDLLRHIAWQSNPDGMLKLPSVAKGTALRTLIEAKIAKSDLTAKQVIEHVQLAARIEQLVAIGGASTRDSMLSDQCILSADDIAKLCRRMPPFIAAKLEELKSGPVNVDANPTGAFDTNGWGELRTRLPKFWSSLQHYARQAEQGSMPEPIRDKCKEVLVKIQVECDRLLSFIREAKPVGAGRLRIAKTQPARVLDWSKAPVKFSQALGVLQKTNRDLRSEHWKLEWKPTEADLEIIRGDAERMRAAAVTLMA